MALTISVNQVERKVYKPDVLSKMYPQVDRFSEFMVLKWHFAAECPTAESHQQAGQPYAIDDDGVLLSIHAHVHSRAAAANQNYNMRTGFWFDLDDFNFLTMDHPTGVSWFASGVGALDYNESRQHFPDLFIPMIHDTVVQPLFQLSNAFGAGNDAYANWLIYLYCLKAK